MYTYITNSIGLVDCLDSLEDQPLIALDVETMLVLDTKYEHEYNKAKDGYGAFDPHTSKVRLVQLRGRTGPCFVIDLLRLDKQATEALKDFLGRKDKTFIGANVKFDIKHIYSTLGVWVNKAWCLFQASLMMQNASGFTDRSHSLASITRDFLGVDLDKTEQSSDWGNPKLTADQLEYAALDVLYLHRLYDLFKSALEDEYKMTQPLELEMDCLVPTARMEFWGLPFDQDTYTQCKQAARYTIPSLAQKIGSVFAEKADTSSTITYVDIHGDGSELAMYKLPFGGKSKVGLDLLMSKTAVVLPILNKIGLDIDNVQRATLNDWKETYPEVKDLIDFYTICKAEQTDYAKWIHPLTSRIYSQTIWSKASTYRAASKSINSQQVSKAQLFNPKTKQSITHRECFRTSVPGKLLCSLDFSSQELAVIGALSGDPGFVGPLNNKEDLHGAVAMKVFGVPKSDIKKPHPKLGKSYRELAKIINFSLAYGKGSAGFSADWRCSKAEAEKVINDYKTQYPILTKFLENQGLTAAATGRATLVNGAIRFVGRDKKLKDSDAYRAGMNFAIQGLSSFMTRVALTNMDRWLEQYKETKPWDCKIVAVVHDEIVLEYQVSQDCPGYKLACDPPADEDLYKTKKQESQDLCKVNCNQDHNCVNWAEDQLGKIMIAAGDYYLKGIVPSGYSAASKKYWSK